MVHIAFLGLIQVPKFVMNIFKFKRMIVSKWLGYVIDLKDMPSLIKCLHIVVFCMWLCLLILSYSHSCI